MTESTLFDQARARSTDPVTSHQAAASVENIGQTREAILKVLRDNGPQTDTQIIKAYMDLWFGGRHMKLASPSGIRSRRSELVKMGFVEAAGTGKTASGRNCIVWRIKK